MGKGLEGLLPRHLGVHREVVHIVMLEHELKEEEGHDPTQSTELCEGKREICGEAHGADLVILEQTEILCLVVTPGDYAPGITPNKNEPKNTSTKSPRTSMVRRAGEASSMCYSKEVKSTMATASYNTLTPFRRETSTGSARNLVPPKDNGKRSESTE